MRSVPGYIIGVAREGMLAFEELGYEELLG
jgi:hypothetical protein